LLVLRHLRQWSAASAAGSKEGSVSGQPHTQTGWIRIGDLARELDEPTHVLRFWESEFGQLTQVKRMAGGSRLYTPETVAVFREVRRLLRVELYTIAGAKRQLKLARERRAC
jgi:DNA-binding transcriptional MerR regulator